MEIFPEVKIVGLSLFLKKEKTLVIGDMHLGYEEALNNGGVLIPRTQFKATIAQLGKILAKTRPRKIILLGDLKHEFGKISGQEWADALKMLDFLAKHAEVVLIRGNHDKILGPISARKWMEIVDNYSIGKYLFCHGDVLIDEKSQAFKDAKILVIGHEHPAITLRDGARSEKYKCFLVGKYKSKKLIVLPSFNLLTEGTDVLREDIMSPYIRGLPDFEVIIPGNVSFSFGKISKLLKKMQSNDYS